MNDDRLRLDLTDLADEVTPVDLRDRALRTSRRLGIQRVVVTSTTAVVMVGAATGTAFALMPKADGTSPLPAGTPTVTLDPSGDVPPTPAPSGSRQSPSPSVTDTTPPGSAVLGGTRYHVGRSGGDAIVRAVRGADDSVLARVPLGDDPCVGNSITVSPDGRRLAWVEDGAASGVGTLMTAAVDGSRKRQVATDVVCLGGNPLVWEGGDLLMVRLGDGPYRSVDMSAGKILGGDPGMERDRWWSPDGRYLAAVMDGEPYVSGPGVSRAYLYDPPAEEAARYDGWAVRSVSMEGRYVAVGWKGTAVSRQDGSFAVVDTTTGRSVDLPVKGEILSIHFTADRKVLVRQANGITVLDSRFRFSTRSPSPPP
ncbi:hypothetical protein ACTMSW_21835 [Micromonospora sp. BQ11]|uniref:hypothetical protein n=1 Tax=Micromonospora sp. BQ11 TaxID=3452212 RepID=UPI003F8A5485